MMSYCTVDLNFYHLTLTTQKIQYFFADKFRTFGSDTIIWGHAIKQLCAIYFWSLPIFVSNFFFSCMETLISVLKNLKYFFNQRNLPRSFLQSFRLFSENLRLRHIKQCSIMLEPKGSDSVMRGKFQIISLQYGRLPNQRRYHRWSIWRLYRLKSCRLCKSSNTCRW